MRSTTPLTKMKRASVITRAISRWCWAVSRDAQWCSAPRRRRRSHSSTRGVGDIDCCGCRAASMNLAMASVEVVDLRQGLMRARLDCKTGGAQTRCGAALARADVALRENLASGGQSLIFLNRRGYHNFLQCNVCGNVIACPNCSVSMTFHLRDRSLRCHYCGNHHPRRSIVPNATAWPQWTRLRDRAAAIFAGGTGAGRED